MEFEEIYTQYFKDVYLYLRSLSADECTAEELTQEVFSKALKALNCFDGSKDIRAWLFTIAKNSYFTLCKKQKLYFSEEIMDQLPDPRVQFTEQLEDEDQAFLIHQVSDAL